MAKLESLVPEEKLRVMDLVRAAGVDVPHTCARSNREPMVRRRW
jgi:hypothetical protein